MTSAVCARCSTRTQGSRARFRRAPTAARSCTTWLRTGSRPVGNAERFYSLSAQIEAERKQYYLELEGAQRGDLDITTWLRWFLGCLDRAISAAERSLVNVLRKARVWERVNRRPVNERQRRVLNRLLDDFQGHLTSSKYAKLARCSRDTARRDIRNLLEYGVLVQNHGGGRSTSYRLAEPDRSLD